MACSKLTDRLRAIKSFVLRQGRLTPGQAKALEILWPDFGLRIADGVINPAQIFDNDSPICLEVGFGMGDSLAEQARLNPDLNYIGIEVHRPGVGHLLRLVQVHGLSNIRVYAEDSVEVLSEVIPDASLALIQLFFPDPWHKKRHHKRRLINERFIQVLISKMAPAALIHIATDWRPYAKEIVELFSSLQAFEPETAPNRPSTKFEKRGIKLGHEICDLAYRLGNL